MKNLFEDIIKERKTCYFVSPHLDDAILSCGTLINELTGKTNVVVVNIFTSAGNKNSLSAIKSVKMSGFKNGVELYKARVSEDAKAFNSIGVKQINLGVKEALWREKEKPQRIASLLSKFIPELTLIYPNYQLNISKGKLSTFDQNYLSLVSSSLKKSIPKDSIVFAPLGVGGHVDHVFARAAVERNYEPIYWLDQPYAARGESKDANFKGLKKVYEMESNQQKKKLIAKYKTQVGLFPNKTIPDLNEKYFEREKDGYKFRLYEKVTPDLKRRWKNLWEDSTLAHYFNSYEWFRTLEQVFPRNINLIVTVEKSNKIYALVTLSRENLYGVSVLKSPGAKFTDRSSVLLRQPDSESLDILLNKLNSFGNVILNEVPEEISEIAGKNVSFNMKVSSVNLQLPFENDPFRFMDSKNKRKIAKVFEENKKSFDLKMGRGSLDLFKIVKKIDAVSYKEKKNLATFRNKLDNKFFTEMIKNNTKFMGINILYFKKKPIAYEMGIRAKDIYYGLNKSFDNNFAYLTPGKINVHLLFKGLNDEGTKLFDMSRGDDMLKRSYTSLAKKQYDIFLFKSNILRDYIVFIKSAREMLVKNPYFYKVYRNLLTTFS